MLRGAALLVGELRDEQLPLRRQPASNGQPLQLLCAQRLKLLVARIVAPTRHLNSGECILRRAPANLGDATPLGLRRQLLLRQRERTCALRRLRCRGCQLLSQRSGL